MKIDKTFLLSSDETPIQQFEQLATELERQELDVSTHLYSFYMSFKTERRTPLCKIIGSSSGIQII